MEMGVKEGRATERETKRKKVGGGEARLFAIFLTSATRHKNSWHPELTGGRGKDNFIACMYNTTPLLKTTLPLFSPLCFSPFVS